MQLSTRLQPALLREGLEYSKHSDVIVAVHRDLVNTGKLDKEHGKNISELFELRGTGDYGGTQHVSQKEAEKAIEATEAFVHGIKEMLERN